MTEKKEPDFEGFARALLDGWPEPWGEGLDGFELQQLAARYNVLKIESRTTPCSEYCGCAEYHGHGETVICYRLNYDPKPRAFGA